MSRSIFSSCCLAALLTCIGVFAAERAAGQARFPNGAITIIVPNAPGGASDISARMLSTPLSGVLNQPVIVLNRGGAGGAIGTQQAARAKADGQTVLLALSTIMVSPEAERVSGRKALYEVNQFEPIALLSSEPMVMLVRADSPWKSLGDVIAAAKAKPGAINYSSSGSFGPIHMSVEMLAHEAGIKFTQIPYGGGQPAIMALLAGQVELTTAVPAVAATYIASGTLRPLTVSGSRRSEALPDVKTYRELGFDAEYTIWAGLFVPKDTPAAVQQILRSSVAQAVESPEYRQAMQKNGIVLDYRDAPDFKRYAEEDGRRLVEAVRAICKID